MTLARRLDWAALLRRVFGEQVTRCPRCGDHLRVLAFLAHPEVTTRILAHLGLASAVRRSPPPVHPLTPRTSTSGSTTCDLAALRMHGIGLLDARAPLRRVFGEQVTRCPRCGDHLRVLAFLAHPEVTTRILAHLGLASAVPPIAPARAPPDAADLELGFDDV